MNNMIVSPSQYSFEEIQNLALANKKLGTACSFAQVEYGVEVLASYWDSYSAFCERYGIRFTTPAEMANDFAREIFDHIRVISGPE
jgi:hypothetical protein